jgi:hypothetical protein
VKAPFQETFQAQPVALAVINEQFERRAGTITEDEKRTREGVLIEAGFAEGNERINPLAKVDGLVSEQDVELRDELDHRRQERRKSAQSLLMETRSRDESVSVRREPSGRSIWSRQPIELCSNDDPTSGNAISAGSRKKAACGFFLVGVRADRLIRSLFSLLESSFKTRPTSEGG